jgi:hypothetical protein
MPIDPDGPLIIQQSTLGLAVVLVIDLLFWLLVYAVTRKDFSRTKRIGGSLLVWFYLLLSCLLPLGLLYRFPGLAIFIKLCLQIAACCYVTYRALRTQRVAKNTSFS